MVTEYQIRVLPEVAYSEQNLIAYLAKEEGLTADSVSRVRVLRRSIDARQRTVVVNLKVRVYINELPQDEDFIRTDYPDVSGRPQARHGAHYQDPTG